MKRWLRYVALVLVRSNVPPFTALYHWGYRVATHVLTWSLVRKCGPQINAIYLRRSLAMGASFPGLSDIDLLVILHDTVTAEQRHEVVAHWDWLCRFFPLLDAHHEIFTVPELDKLIRVEPLFAFRLEEGRQTWKRLYGTDIFFRFPPITGAAYVEGAWAEIKLHWIFFRQIAAAPQPASPYEQIKQTYLLYKCLLAFARAELEAAGQPHFCRPPVLAALHGSDRLALFGQLEAFFDWVIVSQFRGRPFPLTAAFLEECFAYLRSAAQRFYLTFRAELAASPHCRRSEFSLSPPNEVYEDSELVFHLAPLAHADFARGILFNDQNKASHETTFYVSPSGSDFSCGSVDTPWRTLQHAAKMAVPGDRFFVAPGEYRGFCLQGPGAEQIEFYGPQAIIKEPARDTADGIVLRGVRGITIEGFTIRGMPRRGIYCVASEDLVFRNNTLVTNRDAGIWASGVSRARFEGNVVRETQQGSALHVRGSGSDLSFLRNVCTKNAGAGIQINGDCSEGGDGLFTGVEVRENELSQNGTRSSSALDCTGLLQSRIEDNRIVHAFRNGITFYRGDAGGGCRHNVVRDNVIVVGAYSPALEMKEGSEPNQVENNVLVSLNGEVPIVVGWTNPTPCSHFGNATRNLNVREPRPRTRQAKCYNFADDPPQCDPQP